ncbi:MAG: tyrosine-type recombinase/integrase [Bacteroidales bacterium]|nr:tyrosine-type recombinase/integrase [Bacteroidales bacterium]
MIDKYIAYIRDVRRYSPRTQKLYRKALEDFAAWVEVPGQAWDEGKGMAVQEISVMAGQGEGVMADLIGHLIPSRIREYEAHLMESGMKPRTVHLQMSALSGYCNYLIKEGALKSNPVRTVKRPKMEKRLPEYYTENAMDKYLEESAHAAGEEELQILLAGKPSDDLSKELYNRRLRRLIISMLYGTGIRRAELIGLKIGQIDQTRQTLRVKGKGDKMREIPLITSLVQEISLYLQAASFMLGERPSQAPLLVTEKGKPLYPEFVDRAVKAELQGREGITGRKSPHVLRHSLATALLSEGTDLNAIKEMLGHSSLAATEVYTHNSVERLKAQYMNAHPRAKNEERHD